MGVKKKYVKTLFDDEGYAPYLRGCFRERISSMIRQDLYEEKMEKQLRKHFDDIEAKKEECVEIKLSDVDEQLMIEALKNTTRQ
jgi:hypothetical protein